MKLVAKTDCLSIGFLQIVVVPWICKIASCAYLVLLLVSVIVTDGDWLPTYA